MATFHQKSLYSDRDGDVWFVSVNDGGVWRFASLESDGSAVIANGGYDQPPEMHGPYSRISGTVARITRSWLLTNGFIAATSTATSTASLPGRFGNLDVQ